ncbi:phosphatase PAP2 family protein [Natronoglycomyces albus]|uniref:Phosphatase PAP2 family protein n=1 Tax=Natronoglycomyces albus TaxID=2811108 RepID=A0A895XX93_9ACTN|nr:phosphatase PAP2 family protein [Natronoglycomyces albus]QSB06248.1 phosphatase PAP2 family protein [Natronoglycomyces albus]
MQVPEISTDWYLRVVNFVEGWPGWLQTIFEHGTDAGLVVFAVLFLLGWWHARSRHDFRMALALAAPVGTVAAYLVSNSLKDVIEQQRPCQLMPDVTIIATCQEAGSWAFPSNHATVVAAAAAAIIVVMPRIWVIVVAVPVAATMAASRVIVGVHYPHDIIVGMIVGTIVAPLVTLLLAWMFARLIGAMRRTAFFAFFLGKGPDDAAEEVNGATGGTQRLGDDTMMLSKVRDEVPPPPLGNSAPQPGNDPAAASQHPPAGTSHPQPSGYHGPEAGSAPQPSGPAAEGPTDPHSGYRPPETPRATDFGQPPSGPYQFGAGNHSDQNRREPTFGNPQSRQSHSGHIHGHGRPEAPTMDSPPPSTGHPPEPRQRHSAQQQPPQHRAQPAGENTNPRAASSRPAAEGIPSAGKRPPNSGLPTVGHRPPPPNTPREEPPPPEPGQQRARRPQQVRPEDHPNYKHWD